MRMTKKAQKEREWIETYGSLEAHQAHLDALRAKREARKLMSPEERAAAERADRIAYAQLRYSGEWVRKNRVRSPRVAAKLGLVLEKVAVRRAKEEARKKEIVAKWGSLTAYNEHLTALRARREALKKMTPEERHQDFLRQEAEFRDRHRAKINAYNRDYNRRRRDAQATPEQLKRRNELRATRYGNTTAGMIEKLTRDYAAERGMSPDELTAQMVATGAVDFLMRGLESQAKTIKNRPLIRRIAAEALRFYLDRDTAALKML